MSFYDRLKGKNKVLAVILLLALFLRIAIVLTPTNVILPKFFWDDSLMVYSIAENMVNGNGASFDGVIQTNGFQPLWAMVAAAVYKIGFSGDSLVHAMMALSAVIEMGTILLIYRMARKLASERTALIAAALYGLSPLVVFQTLNGMDSVLAVFLTTLTFYILLCTENNRMKPVYLGVCVGFAILSRMDGLILLGSIFLMSLIFERSRMKEKAVAFAKTATVSLAVASPWFIWNFLTFGKILDQSSGAFWRVPYPILSADFFIHATQQTVINAGKALYHFGTYDKGIYSWIFGAILICIMLVSLSKKEDYKMKMVLYCAAMVGFYSSYIISSAPRHFTALAPLIAIILADGLNELTKKLKNRSLRAVPILLILSVIAINGGLMWEKGHTPWEAQMYEAALWLKNNTPEDTLIGSLNGGIVQFYSERRVLNLDGVVSYPALYASRSNRTMEYILENHVNYIAEITSESVDLNNSIVNYSKYTTEVWRTKLDYNRPEAAYYLILKVNESYWL